MDGKANEAEVNIRALIFALLALACGHMLSTLLRTIPAISLDVMAADFRTAPQTLASLTSVYHFAFAASQIPVGAAMDRFGVRPVSLSLLAGTIVGALASGLATGPESFLFGQFLLGVATSGMLMCPMTLAAKQMSAARFGLWSGIILSIGNIGMLLSASPLAFVVELWGWRAGFWISAGFGAVVAIAVFLLVPKQPAGHADQSSPLSQMGRGAAHRSVATAARVDRAVAGVARGLAGAAGIVGRSLADGDQGAQPHRGGQHARPVHARLDRRSRADGGSRSRHRPSPRSAGRHALLCRVVAGADGGRRAALSAGRTARRVGRAGPDRRRAVRPDRHRHIDAALALRHDPATGGRAERRQGAVRHQPRVLPRRGADAIGNRRRCNDLRIARGVVVHGRDPDRRNRRLFGLHASHRNPRSYVPACGPRWRSV